MLGKMRKKLGKDNGGKTTGAGSSSDALPDPSKGSGNAKQMKGEKRANGEKWPEQRSKAGGAVRPKKGRRNASVARWMEGDSRGSRATRMSTASAFGRRSTGVSDLIEEAVAARELEAKETALYGKYVTKKAVSDKECMERMFKTVSECSAENGETFSMEDMWHSIIAIENMQT